MHGSRYPSDEAGTINPIGTLLKDASRCKVAKVRCKCISNAVVNISCKRGLEVRKRFACNLGMMYGIHCGPHTCNEASGHTVRYLQASNKGVL